MSVDEIGTTLETMMGARRVTTFDLDGEEYDVVLQGRSADRRQPADLTNLYVRSARSGEMIPLANLVTVEEQAVPGTLNRFNRLRSITISAGMVPGYTQGEALAFLDQVAREELPAVRQHRLQGRLARVPPLQRRRLLHLRDGAAGRVPGARGAVRELRPPAS